MQGFVDKLEFVETTVGYLHGFNDPDGPQVCVPLLSTYFLIVTAKNRTAHMRSSVFKMSKRGSSGYRRQAS